MIRKIIISLSATSAIIALNGGNYDQQLIASLAEDYKKCTNPLTQAIWTALAENHYKDKDFIELVKQTPEEKEAQEENLSLISSIHAGPRPAGDDSSFHDISTQTDSSGSIIILSGATTPSAMPTTPEFAAQIQALLASLPALDGGASPEAVTAPSSPMAVPEGSLEEKQG